MKCFLIKLHKLNAFLLYPFANNNCALLCALCKGCMKMCYETKVFDNNNENEGN